VPQTAATRLTIMMGVVIALGIIIIIVVVLGIRAMRLDDLKAEHRDIIEQRGLIKDALEEGNKERRMLFDELRRFEAQLEKVIR
jgi:nitrogen fixation-related uncharacterized protein